LSDLSQDVKLAVTLARDDLLSFTMTMKRDYKPGWHHTLIADKLMDVEKGKCLRLMIFMPPRHGKLCADSTPVMTTDGWKNHGDLVVGDFVFTPDGRATKVIAISEPDTADIEVEFMNGEIIKCHRNHEWKIFDRGYGEWKIIETNEFLKTTKFKKRKQVMSGGRCIYQVERIEPLMMDMVKLPLDPYFFGAWLGDGSSTKPALTLSDQDSDIAYRMPYKVNNVCVHPETGVGTYYFGHQKIIQKIRSLDCYDNKHIPDIYKYSCIGQRLQLIAGLIDTDGHVDEKGRVRIVTGSKRLAADIEEVVRSLGWNPYITVQKPTLSTSGIQGKKDVYTVGFNPDTEIPTKLPRKKTKILDAKRRLLGIREVRVSDGPEQGICIQVEDGRGMYLVGTGLIPTHNSELASIRFPSWYIGRNPEKEIISCSYNDELADDFGRKTRNVLKDEWYGLIFPQTELAKDSKRIDRWGTNQGGGYVASGVGGAVTGRGADLLIIDDPIKNREEADSDTYRERVWDWFTSTAYTRLHPDGAVVVIQCMTGDTQVLMAGGTEKRLRDIRKGDGVATYDNGELSTSTVKNWKSNGRDSVLKITTSSGKVVRANKRHPFLTYHNQKLKWTQTKNLTIVHKIVTLKGSGGSGKEKRASSAISQLMSVPIGVESSVSTTATKQGKLEHSCVTTVTSQQDTQKLQKLPLPLQNTSDFILEDIVSIEEDGEEEVFDLQVDRTENFIANGVVSHNTRWHDDDLAGRLLVLEPEKWDIVEFPAIAEGEEVFRKEGEALWPSRYNLEALESIKKTIGIRDWAALYQQNPVAGEAQEFREEWFRTWETLPKGLRVFTTVDPAISKKKSADDTCIMTCGISADRKIFILEYTVGKMNPTELIEELWKHYDKYNPEKVGIEATAYQQSIIHYLSQDMKAKQRFFLIEPLNFRTDKHARVRGLLPFYQHGQIYHPFDSEKLDEQLRRFPAGRKDDIVDCLASQLELLKTPSIKKGLPQIKYDEISGAVLGTLENELSIVNDRFIMN